MTLRKQNTKHTTRHKLTRAVKPLFKPKAAKEVEPAAAASAPAAAKTATSATDGVATVSSIDRVAKKASRSLDIVSPGKPLPSATARPVITGNSPVQIDNTLARSSSAKPATGPTVLDVSHPVSPTMVHRRTMVSQPPVAMAASDTLLTSGTDTPDDADPSKGETATRPAERDITAAGAGRPAKPLLSKPVAAGPTVAELLSKQHADESDIPVTVTAAPTATVGSSAKPKPDAEPRPEAASDDATDSTEDADVDEAESEADLPEEPTSPKPQLVTLGKKAAPTVTPTAAAPIAPPKADDEEVPADVDEASDDDDASKDTQTGMTSLQGDVTAEKAEPTPPPKAELYGGRPVIVIHEAHLVREFLLGVLIFIIGLVVLAAAVNFLLDANIIRTGYNIPHTNLLDPK